MVLYSSFPVSGSGGNAGVGVLNVPPNYADIKILQQDNTIRAYLTVSDYNSWIDIQTVQILLEDNGVILHRFTYQQYEDPEIFSPLNKFIDESLPPLLLTESCDVEHSDQIQTVEERCHLLVRFVFKMTYFTHIHVISSDRAGDTTETLIEYAGGGEVNRDANTLSIPWIDGCIRIGLPPHSLDIMIVITAIVSTILIGRKTPIATTLQQVFYETE